LTRCTFISIIFFSSFMRRNWIYHIRR